MKKHKSKLNTNNDNSSRIKQESEELMEEIVKGYNAGMSIKKIAEMSSISEGKIKKLLVTAGVFSNEIYDRIKNMRLEGKSDEEIARHLRLKKSAMAIYTPYQKGIYGLKNPSKNARNLREYRKSKRFCN